MNLSIKTNRKKMSTISTLFNIYVWLISINNHVMIINSLETSSPYKNLEYLNDMNRTCSFRTLRATISTITSMAIIHEQLWIYYSDHIVAIYDQFNEKHYDHDNHRLYLFDEKFIDMRSYLYDSELMKHWPYELNETTSMGEISLAFLSPPNDQSKLILSYWIALIDLYETTITSGSNVNKTIRIQLINTYNRFLATGYPDNRNEKFEIEHEYKNFSLNTDSLSDEINTQIISLSIDGKFYQIFVATQPAPTVVVFDNYLLKEIYGILCINDDQDFYMIPNNQQLMADCEPPVNFLHDIVFGFNINETLYLISSYNRYVLAVEKRLVISFQRKFPIYRRRSLDDFIICMKPPIWPLPLDEDFFTTIETKTQTTNQTNEKVFTNQSSTNRPYYQYFDNNGLKNNFNFRISIIIIMMFIKYLIISVIYFNVCYYCQNICFHL